MYYRLRSDYVLRGWDKAAWTMVKRPGNQIRILKQKEFQALVLCDGISDFDSELISEDMRAIIHKFEEDKIVEICPEEKELDADQFYRYYNNRYMGSVCWSVTGHCNFRCRHCFMDAPEGALGELSHERAINLIDQMADCGVLNVNLTGGEPFVRKDIWSLIDRILFHKMTIRQIYTNGWLLNDSVLDELEKRNLKPEISISFDGIGWHDWMRGVKGAEEATLRALKLCKQRDFPMNVEMCIHKGNLDTLRNTVRCLSEIGVPFLKTSIVQPTELWRKNSEGNMLDVHNYFEAMISYIPDFFQDGMPMNIMLSGVISLYKDSKEYRVLPVRYNSEDNIEEQVLCGAARFACYITPEGRLLPCMPMTACKEQNLFPLVQDIGLQKGLSDSFYMKIIDSRVKGLLAVNPKCATCDHKYQCGGGCRAVALEQTGDLMGSDSMQCVLWKEGYVDRIRKAADEAVAKYCK